MQIPVIGSTILFLDTVDSTNTELARISGNPETINGTAVLAFEQTAGRGRRGNSWLNEPNKDLTFSFILQKPAIKAEFAFLPVAAAAVASTAFLQQLVPQQKLEIKWPNDILCQEKKICGMLIENTFTGSQCAKTIVGIGINLNGTRYAETRFPATSVFIETEKNRDIKESLVDFLPFLNESFSMLFTHPEGLMKRYNSLLYGKNELKTIQVGEQRMLGKIKTVDMHGNPHILNENGQPIAARPDEIQFLPE